MRCASCSAELPPDSEKCSSCNAVAQRAPGERRQITALFCDIIGSTQLAAQLDGEDYNETLNSFHTVCAQIVVAHGGHLAQYLGDGVMAYFGHPTAHEDDPQRAARAALEVIHTIPALRPPTALGARTGLSVRVGIDTGLVVVGAGPSGLATGPTLNCAARVQAIAEPNSVFVTEETHKLIAAQFECVSVGARALKGFAGTTTLYRVVSERRVRHTSATLTPFVGRQREIERLLEAWRAVAAGQKRSIIVVGDAGLGKTRLIEHFIEIATTGATHGSESLPVACVRVLRGQGSLYRQHTAFHPLIEALEQLPGQSSPMPAATRAAVLAHWLEERQLDRREVPALLQLLGQTSNSQNLPALDPGRKGQIIEDVKRVFSRVAEQGPLILSVEDLHWVDPSTLDVLGALRELKSVFLLGTCRPGELAAWADAASFDRLELERLPEPDVDSIVRAIAGRSVEESLLEAVVQTTDGVPLFVEEQTKMLLESARESDRPHTIAPSLQASLLARLDRLGEAKRVAQFAAVVGRSVPRVLLAAGSELAGSDLDAALDRLTSAGLLRQVELRAQQRDTHDASLADSGTTGEWSPGPTYVFKHALVQEAAYQSLVKADRRRFHGIVADRLERAGFASASRNPEVLAHHHGQAQALVKSARYGLAAARRGMDAGGYREAREHIDNALTRLAQLRDDSEGRELELELRLLEGFCLISAVGYGAPSVHQAFARAKELVTTSPRSSGEPSDLMRAFSVLWGVWSFFVVVPDFPQASMLGAEMERLARQSGDRNLLLELGVVLGMPALWGGQLETARRHFESTLELGSSNAVGTLRFNQDPVVVAGAHLAWIHWLQGDPAKADAASERAIAFARTIEHPYSEAYARAYGSVLCFFLRDPVAARKNAATLEVLSDRYGFPTWKAVGAMIRGWALACDDEAASALPLVEESFNLWELVGVGLNRPARLAIRAEVKARAGDVAGAQADVEEALAMGASNGDRYFEAELMRLRGEFTLLGDGAADQAEHDFEAAMRIASAQGAHVLVERAAASLRHLRSAAPPSSGVGLVPGAEPQPAAESGIVLIGSTERPTAR